MIKDKQFNLKGLWSMQFIIESLMANKIDRDENIPSFIIGDLAKLHSDITNFINKEIK